MSFVEFENVSFSYNNGTENQAPAVKNFSLKVEEGEFVALVGHNGSGKSTVAKLINGLITPTSGTVTVDGMSTADNSKLFDIRKNIGVVFQNPDNQMIATIIEDDIAFGPENLGVDPEEISRRVDYALELVSMTGHRKGTPFRLSGGQKQRIAIAGVLAIMPKVLVLDEATAMLDPIGRSEVMNVIKTLREQKNMTVIMITHFMEEAAEADRIVVLNEGQIILQGGKEVFEKENELEAVGLDVPQSIRIANKLRKKGVKISAKIFDFDDLAGELCR